MNNLGGYKSIELIFVDELSVGMPIGNNKIYLRKCNVSKERVLPITQGISIECSSKKSDEGASYDHNASIVIVRVPELLKNELHCIHYRGCIVVATTNNNEVKVYGTKMNPLFGTFDEVIGSKPSDLHNFKLSLSALLMHPALSPL